MKALVLVGALLLGLCAGRWLVQLATGPSEADGKAGSEEAPGATSPKRRSSGSSNHAKMVRLLSRNASNPGHGQSFGAEVRRIHKDAKSPLRAQSFLALHIHQSSFDDLEASLRAGDVQRPELLGELGLRLALEDPERAIHLLGSGPFPVGNLDNYYAFRNPIIRNCADHDPHDVLRALEELKRGGVQMDASLYFSNYLAYSNPVSAAENFNALVQLRNMGMEGSLEMPDKAYARQLMKSWVRRNREEAVGYVIGLPPGEVKMALGQALEAMNSVTEQTGLE